MGIVMSKLTNIDDIVQEIYTRYSNTKVLKSNWYIRYSYINDTLKFTVCTKYSDSTPEWDLYYSDNVSTLKDVIEQHEINKLTGIV